MPLRPQLRAYLMSVIYAGALLFVPACGSRLFSASLLHFAIVASLLALMVLLLAHRDEVVEFVVRIFRAGTLLLLCLLRPLRSGWLTVPTEPSSTDPFRAVLFQRPPPHLA